MSSTPTIGMQAPNSSGRCTIDGADQQAAVAAAHDGELVARRAAFGDQPFGRGDEVVEHVLLLDASCRPGATLRRTRRRRAGWPPPGRRPCSIQAMYSGLKRRRQRNVVAAVAVEQRRVRLVRSQVLAIGERSSARACRPCCCRTLARPRNLSGSNFTFGWRISSILFAEHVVAIDARSACCSS